MCRWMSQLWTIPPLSNEIYDTTKPPNQPHNVNVFIKSSSTIIIRKFSLCPPIIIHIHRHVLLQQNAQHVHPSIHQQSVHQVSALAAWKTDKAAIREHLFLSCCWCCEHSPSASPTKRLLLSVKTVFKLLLLQWYYIVLHCKELCRS